ncbi:MAG TPA: AAA family ATPase [Thermoleophilaceae bacterium]|jgi:cell division protease FtsH
MRRPPLHASRALTAAAVALALLLPSAAQAESFCVKPAKGCDNSVADGATALRKARDNKGPDTITELVNGERVTRNEAEAAEPATSVAPPAEQPASTAAAVDEPSFMDDIGNWALTWMPLVFMGLITLLIFMTMRFMPRTKPQEIKPDTSQSIRWEDVAGADEAKAELREVVDFLRDPKRFKKLGAKVPKGILLHGPPGTGKTLLAKAVANESRAKFFAQSASSFVEMFAGLGAARIRRLFRIARKQAPSIVFIDELDAVGATRGKDVSGEKDQTLNQLLVEMDGFNAADDLVVIAASNLLEKLDPALLRPGRFDRQILVAPPDLKGRMEILKVHTRNKPVRNVDFELVARQTSGLSGAELANICNEAAIFAGRRGRDHVVMDDFDAALERVVAGMQTRKVINDHEKRVIAYHEAGHALCAELLESQEKTHRISIIPRGRALGYTLHLPVEDRYLKTKEEMNDWMVVGLGGRVAEAIVFGAITTGAANDLEKVYSVSRSMVTEYGMGNSISSRRLPVDDYSVSEASRRMVDEEQQELTDMAYRRAREIIVANRPLLDALANHLLSQEVLEREDIERIMTEYREGRLGYGDAGETGRAATEEPEPGVARLAASERFDGAEASHRDGAVPDRPGPPDAA